MAFLLLLPVYAFAAPAEQGQTPPSSPPAETAKTEQTGKDETGSVRLGNVDLIKEEYVVQEGDWLIKILREKGVPDEEDVLKILKLLKELNTSFRDLNVIRPGEKIVILVKAGSPEKVGTVAAPAVEIGAPESAGAENKEQGNTGRSRRNPKFRRGRRVSSNMWPHKMRQGDSIGALAIALYGLSRDQLYNEYYPLFRGVQSLHSGPGQSSGRAECPTSSFPSCAGRSLS